jgi:hypothetical protein
VTGDDDLRARLAAVDPARLGAAPGALSQPSPARMQEHIMATIDQPTTAPESAPEARRRTRLLAAAAALVLLAAAGVASLITTTSDDGAPGSSAPTTVALKIASSTATSSCIRFDVKFLHDMPVALAGTVTSVTAEAVTLEVDLLYKGGTSDRVTISVPDANTSISLDGVHFVDGKRYLLTATNGTVNGCGFSGPVTPELERAYSQAFRG